MKWGKSSKPGPDDYDGRIQEFLDTLGESTLKRLLTRKEPLQDLFDLVRRLQADQRKLEKQFVQQTTAFSSQSDALADWQRAHKDLSGTNEDLLRRLEAESKKLRNCETKIEQITHQSKQDLKNLTRQSENTIQQLTRQSEQAYQQLQRQSERDIQQLQRQTESDIKQLKENHHTEVTTLKQESKSEHDRLVAQILINQSDTEQWEDEKLKFRFLELHRLINDICSHRRSELHFPTQGNIRPEIDPFNFFARNNRERGHFLLKRCVWSILQTQLFGQPFGFGALGPGGPEQELFKLFGNWEAFCRPSGVSRPTPDELLELFGGKTLSDRWRKVTFQTISSEDQFSESSGPRPVDKLRASNLANTNNQIFTYLQAVAALSQRNIGQEFKTDIASIVNKAEALALQFGIHSSELVLVNPSDSWNGDPAPGLVKITKGDDDEIRRLVIVDHKGKS